MTRLRNGEDEFDGSVDKAETAGEGAEGEDGEDGFETIAFFDLKIRAGDADVSPGV